jgi:transposase
MENVCLIMGVSQRSVLRWMALFEKLGDVVPNVPRQKSARWPAEVYIFVKQFIEGNPCFYIQELQEQLLENFPDVTNVSCPTICRALRHDLKLSRKVLEKRARESVPLHLKEYFYELSELYSYPEQLIFIDETSKDGRDALRRYGWSRINTPAVVHQPFSRGGRVSVLAAFDTTGFCSWECTKGTFTRQKFHSAFLKKIAPLLQPWPLPRSIVVLDNARIHMYSELEQVIHSCSARIIYLPPYSPQLNPIQKGFGLLKQWLAKNADHVFRECPDPVLDVAMRECINLRRSGYTFYESCGYSDTSLIEEVFGLQNVLTNLSRLND